MSETKSKIKVFKFTMSLQQYLNPKSDADIVTLFSSTTDLYKRRGYTVELYHHKRPDTDRPSVFLRTDNYAFANQLSALFGTEPEEMVDFHFSSENFRKFIGGSPTTE